jgi:hypothetical protein
MKLKNSRHYGAQPQVKESVLIKSFIFITMLVSGIAATGIINISKDSLKICNNPFSSFIDGIIVTNNTPVMLYIDSAIIVIDELDTTGSGQYGLNGRLQAFWRGHLETPEQYFWNLEKIDDNKYRMIRWNSTPADTQSIRFTAQLRINALEIGTCLGCSGVPTWYPPFFKGSLVLYLSNGQVNIRLYSDDLRGPGSYGEPCSDYACDSLNVRKILDKNGMESVPVGSFTSVANGRIVTLRLSYNPAAAVSLPKKCTVLPPEIGNLTALKSLEANGNSFGSLPQQIGRCINLTTILANNNGITALPDSIVHCTGLRNILMDNNQLTRLPDSIGKMRSLKSLSITKNLLTSLPESMVELDSMDCLFIAGNRICTLPESVIAWMTNVQTNTHCAKYEPTWPDSQKCDSVSTELIPTGQRSSGFAVKYIARKGNFITIETGPASVSARRIEIFDLSGRTMETINLPDDPRAVKSIRLNAARYPAGWYYIRATSGTSNGISRAFIIDR